MVLLRAERVATNEKITIGVVGRGGQSQGDVGNFLNMRFLNGLRN